ncbi:hypothetical protein QJS10_CPA08g01819 [Acorus calamus]|uniref:Uncharacterized protein n=1 Tax=Acorus calamus TaxID=4465 RepID=A0AAV9EC47_ACOCL|nr:hypothetical protein QJS10_CPA08g01819 [Acorus calamus]
MDPGDYDPVDDPLGDPLHVPCCDRTDDPPTSALGDPLHVPISDPLCNPINDNLTEMPSPAIILG